jgi:hypothetical protein
MRREYIPMKREYLEHYAKLFIKVGGKVHYSHKKVILFWVMARPLVRDPKAGDE